MKYLLYLGTDPSQFQKDHPDCTLIHYPMIKISARDPTSEAVQQSFEQIPFFSHLIFTSKNAVSIFFQFFFSLKRKKEELADKELWAVGKVTAAQLELEGFKADKIADNETQEGIIEMLSHSNLKDAYFFLPRSSLSRNLLCEFMQQANARFLACDLYDTFFQKIEPIPDFNLIDEIVFTSPSTVESFFYYFPFLPSGKIFSCSGPITKVALEKKLKAINYPLYAIK